MARVSARGLDVHVQRLGEGPPTAVFLHGLVMDNLSSWYFTVAPGLAEVADVVLYDLRGHGRTTRPGSGYAIADLVADLDALLDALEIDGPVDLVGNSFGGLLAVAYAIAHPERTRGLALVDGNLADEGWGPDVARKFRLEGKERDRLIARYAYRWAGRQSERKTSRLARTAEELVHETTLVDDLAAAPAVTDEDLRSLECPVLALYGDDSELLAKGRRIARLAPRAELRLFEGGTHLLLWERTAVVRQALREWLTRVDQNNPS